MTNRFARVAIASAVLAACGDRTGLDSPRPTSTVATLPATVCRGTECVWQRLAVREWHSCAIRPDATVRCWGRGFDGQLGDGATGDGADTAHPVTVASNALEVAAGVAHTCALFVDGNIACWGYNAYGQLGDGTTTSRSTPTNVALAPALHVVLGDLHSCALLEDHTVSCWGRNDRGILGDGTAIDRSKPSAVHGLSDVDALWISGDVTVARVRDGRVFCWGAGGTLPTVDGCDGARTRRISPASLAAFDGASEVSYPCAILPPGGARCFGMRWEVPALVDRFVPRRIPELDHATAVSVGFSHACARMDDATVACWGWNRDGELGVAAGLGLSTYSVAPAVVVELTNVVSMQVGDGHTCALRADDSVACWGANAFGELGDGTRTGRYAPRPVVW